MDNLLRVRLVIALVASLMIGVAACSSDKYQNIKPVSTDTSSCKTANMSFVTDIRPILEAECDGCHSTANSGAGGGIVLDNYNAVKSLGTSIQNRVSLPNSDASFMPKGGSSIGTCKIDKIRAWINQGSNP